MDQEARRLAVLIDAENAQLAILAELLAEIAKIGAATVKRVYGDFTSPAPAAWREPLLSDSILPVQQFRYTVHKNASDSALIIDAMGVPRSRWQYRRESCTRFRSPALRIQEIIIACRSRRFV